MNVAQDKKTGQITYTRQFNIQPFFWKVFPTQRDRFAVLIVCSPSAPELPALVRFVLNAWAGQEKLIQSDDLCALQGEFRNEEQPVETLRNKVALLDLSAGHAFKSLHSSVSPTWTQTDNASNNWLRNYRITNILYPNHLPPVNEAKTRNFSHTVWLAGSLDEVPPSVLTQVDLAFVADEKQISEYLKQQFRIEIQTANDVILAVSSTLVRDRQIMTMSKERFSPKAEF